MRILSDLIIPFLLVVPFLKDSFRENYSSLSRRGDPLFFICLIPLAAYTVYMIRSLCLKDRRLRPLYLLYVLLLVLTFLVPYHIPEDMFSSLHLVFSYGAFIVFQLIIFPQLSVRQSLMRFYTCGLFLSLLICFTAASISAPAEAVCGIVISITMERLSEA